MQNIKKTTRSNLARGLIACFFLFTGVAEGQGLDDDKKLHYQVSAIMGSGFYFMHNAYNTKKEEEREKTLSISFSLTACGATGLAKEFYDEYQASGFDSKDLLADVAGCLTGAYASKFINENISISPTFDNGTEQFNGIQISKLF